MAKRGRPKKVVLENLVDDFNEDNGQELDIVEPIKLKAAKAIKSSAPEEPPVTPPYGWDANYICRDIFVAMLRNKNKFEDYVLDDAIAATKKIYDTFK